MKGMVGSLEEGTLARACALLALYEDPGPTPDLGITVVSGGFLLLSSRQRCRDGGQGGSAEDVLGSMHSSVHTCDENGKLTICGLKGV